MVKIIQEHPFVDPDGFERYSLISFWAEDENGVRYIMLQVKTGNEYNEVVDVYPSQYTYIPTNKKDKDPTLIDEQVEEN